MPEKTWITLAYHSDPAIKRKYVNRMKSHRAADELVQKCTWESNGHQRGCAVGCCFHDYNHSKGPVEIGYPEELMHLDDAIFEGLPASEAGDWAVRFLQAAKPGADLSLVFARFAVWNLTDEKWGAVALPDQPAEAIECCRNVAALWQRVIDGEPLETLRREFRKQEDLAGAWAGAWARAAARAAAARAWARADYWRACADELERLIKSAPVKQ